MRQEMGHLLVDVQGVGYNVHVPLTVWEQVQENEEQTLWISTYVRVDRLDLFGFLDRSSRIFFVLVIAQSGIGPKLGLELCSVPRDLLVQAIHSDDASLLTSVKGVGKKKAEKLMLELKTVLELQPAVFGSSKAGGDAYDHDAVEALAALGYDKSSILNVLKKLPANLGTTEERVTEALRKL